LLAIELNATLLQWRRSRGLIHRVPVKSVAEQTLGLFEHFLKGTITRQ